MSIADQLLESSKNLSWVWRPGFARVLRDPAHLDRLVNHPAHKVPLFVAGKAHPQGERGRYLLQTAFRSTRGPSAGWCSSRATTGSPASRPHPLLQNSTYDIRGGRNISTLDGWRAQAYDGDNKLALGRGGEPSNPDYQDPGLRKPGTEFRGLQDGCKE